MDHKVKNYSDVYCSCYFEGAITYNAAVMDHCLLYIASGELLITLNGETTTYKKGEAVFIRRNHNVKMVKRATSNGEPFLSSFFTLHRSFLKAQQKSIIIPRSITHKKIPDLLRVSDSPMIKGLFSSLHVYFNSGSEPSDKLLELKKEEALNALLQTDEAFYSCLFDFSAPWKIDLEEFMKESYKEPLSVSEMAALTARSVASFKRDFQKVFNTTPQRWVMYSRLKEAHRLITQEHLRPSDVYLEIGFKNLAHFSAAFKKEFGATPNNLPYPNY